MALRSWTKVQFWNIPEQCIHRDYWGHVQQQPSRATLRCKSFTKSLERYLWKYSISFIFPVKVKLHVEKLCLYLKLVYWKTFLKDFFVFRDSLQFFGDEENTYLAEHLLMTASSCKWFINISEARFLKRAKNSATQWKANLSNRWKTVKSIKMLDTL